MGQNNPGIAIRRLDTAVILWGIRACLPLSPTTGPLPTATPSPPVTPALVVLERQHLSTGVADEIHNVTFSSSQTLTIVIITDWAPWNPSSPHASSWDSIGQRPKGLGGVPPPLDLDMQGSLLPSPGDPFWDRRIHAIYRLPGLAGGYTSGEGNDGRSEDRFKGIPNRWWSKCRWGWEEFQKALS